jgi:hypothetical protein
MLLVAICRVAQRELSQSAAWSFSQGGIRYFSQCLSLTGTKDPCSTDEPETLVLAHSEAVSE